ncbi:hypothetical protein D9M71_503980 [compost metagenome]
MNENSGGDVNYYALQIKHPKRFEPCMVECEDVIRALGLNFFEGEAFKAIWRKGAQRTLGVGKTGNTALRDAQKMAHYGARELAHEEQLAAAVPQTMDSGADVKYGLDRALAENYAMLEPTDPTQWMVGDVLQGASGQQYRFLGLGKRTALVESEDGTDLELMLHTLTWVARPDATRAPAPELPWIAYTCGPVPGDDWVEVCTANGGTKVGRPSSFVWGGHGTKSRITHYRPAVKP